MLRVHFNNLVHWLRAPSPLPRWQFIAYILAFTAAVLFGLASGYDSAS